MNGKLKPCPFCGGGAGRDGIAVCGKGGKAPWRVRCLGCDSGTGGRMSADEAARAWNARVCGAGGCLAERLGCEYLAKVGFASDVAAKATGGAAG